MKHFLKKKWHSVPVALVSALLVLVLVAGGALATVHITEPQTITQTVEVWEYGSITVAEPSLTLPNLKVGGSCGPHFNDAVVVEVGLDGVGKYLHLKLDADSASLYTIYQVTLSTGATGGSQPEGSDPVILIVGFGMPGVDAASDVSQRLEVEGTYTFTETIFAMAGDTAGTAVVNVTFTLEDIP